MQNKQEITLQEIAGMINDLGTKVDALDARMDALDTRMDTLDLRTNELGVAVSKLETKVERLEDRTFSPEEKEEILTMVRHYNQWLEEETLGTRRITLTREEYDAIQKTVGFPNRFSI